MFKKDNSLGKPSKKLNFKFTWRVQELNIDRKSLEEWTKLIESIENDGPGCFVKNEINFKISKLTILWNIL